MEGGQIIVKLHLGILAEFLQVPQHGLGVHIALVDAGGHGLHGDLLQANGNVRHDLAGRHGLGADVLDGHGDGGVPVEGQAAGQHLIEDDTGGVNVGAGVDVAASGLLRGDIVDGAQGLLGHGVLGSRHDAGDAEVSYFDAAVPQDHDVLGLDVPVDDPPAVGVAQGPDDLGDEVEGLPPVQAAVLFLHILFQGNAVDELHDDIVQVIPLAHVVDGNDVGVGEHGNGLGLLVEAAAELGVRGQVFFQDLDGNKPMQPMAIGFVDHRHAADADHVQDLISVIEHFTDVLIHGNTLLLTAGTARR